MVKADIARRIHQQIGIWEKEVATLFDGILELSKVSLQRGEPILIFGKFSVRSKAPRQGRSPRTGEAIVISTRRV